MRGAGDGSGATHRGALEESGTRDRQAQDTLEETQLTDRPTETPQTEPLR